MCRGVFFFLHSFAVNLIKWEASCLPKWPEALEGESTQTFSFPGNRIYTKCFLFARCLVFKRKIWRFLKKFSWKGKVLFERLENNFFFLSDFVLEFPWIPTLSPPNLLLKAWVCMTLHVQFFPAFASPFRITLRQCLARLRQTMIHSKIHPKFTQPPQPSCRIKTFHKRKKTSKFLSRNIFAINIWTASRWKET